MTPELQKLLDEAKIRYEAMTPEEKEAMHKTQHESWVRGEMEFTKLVKKKWVNGVLVYEDYESYCLD